MADKKPTANFSAEVSERAIRMVGEHVLDYRSQRDAISSIAPKIGCTAETLRLWILRSDRDAGERLGPSTSAQAQFRAVWVNGSAHKPS